MPKNPMSFLSLMHMSFSCDWTCLDTKTFFTLNPISVMRGHAYKLYKPPCRSSLRKNVFVERVINVWNSLPKNVDFSSLSKFKKSVSQIDFSPYLKNTP